jgi:hypothetical protein
MIHEETKIEYIEDIEEINALYARAFAIMTGSIQACAMALLWAGLILNSATCYLVAGIMLFVSALLIYFSIDFKTKEYIWHYIASFLLTGIALFLACTYIYSRYAGALTVAEFIDVLASESSVTLV